MAYLWLKTFHIVGVVVWFAGLFYLVRLFVYHREADERSPEARDILQAQLSIMESRLFNIITTPGMILTLGTAGGLLIRKVDMSKGIRMLDCTYQGSEARPGTRIMVQVLQAAEIQLLYRAGRTLEPLTNNLQKRCWARASRQDELGVAAARLEKLANHHSVRLGHLHARYHPES